MHAVVVSKKNDLLVDLEIDVDGQEEELLRRGTKIYIEVIRYMEIEWLKEYL